MIIPPACHESTKVMLRLGDNSPCENYGFAIETGPLNFVRVADFENATALGVGRLTGPNVPV